MRNQYLKEKLDQVKSWISGKTLRAVDLVTQKGASSCLTVLPIRDMNFEKIIDIKGLTCLTLTLITLVLPTRPC